MRREQFQVGLEFWCAGRRWRCTALGSRVVVAARVESGDVEPGTEQIFHEYDLSACTLSPDGCDS
jgi:hypothetical protein